VFNTASFLDGWVNKTETTTVLRPFFWDYPGELVPEENLLLDFYGARQDNRGRHIDHSIRTNQ